MQLKRESPGTGSWNIQEEIRRVRSKATEEMLRTLPSSKIDRSAFSLEHKSSPNSLVTEKLDDSKGDKMLTSTQPVDASLNLAIGQTTSHGFPGMLLITGWKEIIWFIPVIYCHKSQNRLPNCQIYLKFGEHKEIKI
jgi:hypothetical protein